MLAFQIISILCFLASVANLVRVINKERSAKASSMTPAPRPPVARPAAPRPAPPRPAVPAAPVARPAPPIQSSTEALHPVAKPAVQASSADEKDKDDLFAGLKPTDGDDAAKKVKRLQELGFHHSIETTAQTPKDDIGPAKPRTQTAELDDILKRIDKVLIESQGAAKPAGDQPAAAVAQPAPAAPAAQATPAAEPAPGESVKPDAGQQRLF